MTEERGASLPLNRGELDRVIRRATELQFREGAADEGELSEAEVLRIGREVGLESEYMRRALGEVRAEALVPALAPDKGILKRLVGAAQIRADRVVPGQATETEERLVHWFSEAESLHLVRRRAGFSLWEPAEGFVAQLQRGLKWHGQRYELAQARQVELSVQDLEDGFSFVTLTVDLRNLRMELGGGHIAGFGFLGGGLALAISAGVLAPPAIVAAGAVGIATGALGGLGLGRSSFRGKGERIRLAAEGLLDRLERGELKGSPGARR
ncbi:MAG: hypothetical protein EA351_09250 [Gemmatimonadales bacterium]|nr:MAG: hypothetical protein EA351_09250 [Gemmatimonadales bacterium]